MRAVRCDLRILYGWRCRNRAIVFCMEMAELIHVEGMLVHKDNLNKFCCCVFCQELLGVVWQLTVLLAALWCCRQQLKYLR